MRNKTLTKAQAAKLEKLRENRDEAMNGVFDVAANNVTPFIECYQMAPIATKTRYDETIKTLREFEDKMIDEGRGYRNSFGSFCQFYY